MIHFPIFPLIPLIYEGGGNIREIYYTFLYEGEGEGGGRGNIGEMYNHI
jgi:hypothetical protein